MVRTQHPANLLLAALTLALIAWCGTRSEAAAQGPQSPTGVEQSDHALTGGAGAEQPDDAIEPDEAGPDENMPPGVEKGAASIGARKQAGQDRPVDRRDASSAASGTAQGAG
jgi:hypothetical protein